MADNALSRVLFQPTNALKTPALTTPEMLPPGQTRAAGYDEKLRPFYLELLERAALGEVPHPGNYDAWKRQYLQRPPPQDPPPQQIIQNSLTQ